MYSSLLILCDNAKNPLTQINVQTGISLVYSQLVTVWLHRTHALGRFDDSGFHGAYGVAHYYRHLRQQPSHLETCMQGPGEKVRLHNLIPVGTVKNMSSGWGYRWNQPHPVTSQLASSLLFPLFKQGKL